MRRPNPSKSLFFCRQCKKRLHSNKFFGLILPFPIRVISSVGRASALQAECRRFDSVITHHFFGYLIRQMFCAVVAQLVRVPACHAGGRGFEPRPPRQSPFHTNSLVRRRVIFLPMAFVFIHKIKVQAAFETHSKSSLHFIQDNINPNCPIQSAAYGESVQPHPTAVGRPR